ncbi:MAG: hypothetical protein EOP88_21175 [Verrucomicrobiaceae bacterium]|nr:MAG: hypothetical protein EOP88_21175 [Verrucomicrobiaceae bacterium]
MDQAFLWLPGFTDEHEHPYGTLHNESTEDSHPRDVHLTGAEDQIYQIPPFPVSADSHISWHTDVTPPYPYHPVPVVHALTAGEMDELGLAVIRMMDDTLDLWPDPRLVLRNNHKSYILAALARMGLLQSIVPNSFEPARERAS